MSIEAIDLARLLPNSGRASFLGSASGRRAVDLGNRRSIAAAGRRPAAADAVLSASANCLGDWTVGLTPAPATRPRNQCHAGTGADIIAIA
jgi:hypothetical protein